MEAERACPILDLTSPSVAGLYVHVPFRRGPSAPTGDNAGEAYGAGAPRYASALRRECRTRQPLAAEAPIQTVYVGGGRPSLLPRRTADVLHATIRDVVGPSRIEEATVELSPADVTEPDVRTLRRRGVDRLSLDVRSFDPDALQALDAPHSADDAVQALGRARAAGIDKLSVDLLFGWANRPRARWAADLRRVVDLNVPHVTIIEASPTSRSGASAETRADCLEHAMRLLDSEGYEQYELTHFARPGHRSVHQTQYYAHENQLGVGPSAESFWWPDRPRTERARRWTNVSDLDPYIAHLEQDAAPVASEERLDRPELAREYILLRLRTSEGLDLQVLRTLYGVDLRARKSTVLTRLGEAGLLHEDSASVRLTRRGRLLTDAITQRLLPYRPR